MAVSMDDDVPLILTLDDSGSSASAPLDELDREELPNERDLGLNLLEVEFMSQNAPFLILKLGKVRRI
ncbi:hypothetical protein DUI87_17489 [Hirundo rustica rustica]|uniref:Uncharacterized protein n=1 Tax=Hirundo rustica rustica TaxID=333673 RepID=A0A3M0K3Y7_HIRRU|nr:hypothetical protein DUI87_17489 [Hirundo rustica rustica]